VKKLCILASILIATAFLGCSGERGGETDTLRPDAPPTAGKTVIDVSNQAEFEYACQIAGPGATIRFTAGIPFPGYMVPSWCTDCLEYVNLVSIATYPWVVIGYDGVPARFTGVSLQDLSLRLWTGHQIELEDVAMTRVYTQITVTDYVAELVCDGTVSVEDCVKVNLHVNTGAHVVSDGNHFYGASDRCDLGLTTVEPLGTLEVPSWRYGDKLYSNEGLILSTDVIAMAGCMWGYLRIRVADPEADVGKIRYGDSGCNQFQMTTSVIGSYHYAAIPIYMFPDRDFYWQAEIGFCDAGDGLGAAVTSCTRSKLGRAIPGCPEPLWWPY
jgi:hypothetical protein